MTIVNLSPPKEYTYDDIIDFGKYKGFTVEEVLDKNPGYLIWSHSHIAWFILSEEVKGDAMSLILTNNYRGVPSEDEDELDYDPYYLTDD